MLHNHSFVTKSKKDNGTVHFEPFLHCTRYEAIVNSKDIDDGAYIQMLFGPVSDIENLNRGMVSIVRYHIDIISPDQKDYDGLHDMTQIILTIIKMTIMKTHMVIKFLLFFQA